MRTWRELSIAQMQITDHCQFFQVSSHVSFNTVILYFRIDVSNTFFIGIIAATTRNLSLTKQSTKEKPEETKKDTDRFLSRLPPAVVVNGVVVDIRGAISSQISPSTDQVFFFL